MRALTSWRCSKHAAKVNALQRDFCTFKLRCIALTLAPRLLQRQLVRARIDQRHQVAFAHHLPFSEQQFLKSACYLWAHFYNAERRDGTECFERHRKACFFSRCNADR